VVGMMLQFMIKSFVIYEIYPFFADASKEYSMAPEVFFADIGWLNAIRGFVSIDTHDGKINENFVINQCIAHPQYTTYFYKKKNGTEIDIVLKDREGRLVLIEVKSSDNAVVPKSFA
jgi:predicted AAA+ superfamily ATPase